MKDSKHSIFDGIILLLGAESASEDFENPDKSSGGTITNLGIDKVAQLCENWSQLNQNLTGGKIQIDTFELSFIIVKFSLLNSDLINTFESYLAPVFIFVTQSKSFPNGIPLP